MGDVNWCGQYHRPGRTDRQMDGTPDSQTSRQTDMYRQTVSQTYVFFYLGTLDQNMIDVEWKVRYTVRQ